MKDFLKFTLATVTGIIVSSVVLFFISILVVFSMVSSSESETQVRKNSVMMLDLNGTLAERSQENPLDILMKDDYKTYGLDDVLSSIRKAKENENIKGIYIQANSLSAGYASLEEIRHALKDFKESGKFIVAYGDSYTQSLYYLSSIADKVMLNPQGMLEWRGLAATPMFFKDLLEKIGVEMQVFKVGTYKSAVEPFIATEMSPANREQVNVYLSSVWGQITGDIAESRNLSVEALNKEADRMLMFYPAEESVKNGLVDTLIYKNDVRDYLKTLVGIDKDDDMPVLGIQDMVNVKKNVPKDKSGNVIAVYYAYGEIDGGSSASTEEGINSEKVIRDLRKLKDDENVKAVVLRVNSPGGSAYGSEQIWYAVEQLKKEKPVIVSMGDYAASGGYYIACNADTIVAEPTTLTGSIGIFGMMPNAKGLTEKLGLNFDVVKTNPYADFGNLTRFSDASLQALQDAGVEVEVFNPVHRYVNRIYFNYRDHRKIAVIDGVHAYTGGINIADEYANLFVRFGHWKDTGVRIDGAGAWGFASQFIQMWKMIGRSLPNEDDYYRPRVEIEGTGWCQPFTDGPLNNPDNPIEDTYLQLIASAQKMLYITTPYYAVEESMQKALCIAADAGVDVRLVVPAIPDKKYVYMVAETYWGELLAHGVKIYRYTPGFVHAKSVMVDREVALVGSTNMDYRTFQLHYECAVLLYHMPAVEDLLEDMDRMVAQSAPYTLAEWNQRSWLRKMCASLLRLVAIWF